jgi:hypothetical protein
MGCNCGKNRQSDPPPTGSTPPDPNANQLGKAATSFSLDTTDGRTLTFGSDLEARAARIRQGGGRVRSA